LNQSKEPRYSYRLSIQEPRNPQHGTRIADKLKTLLLEEEERNRWQQMYSKHMLPAWTYSTADIVSELARTLIDILLLCEGEEEGF
jgi:hypothetical protein